MTVTIIVEFPAGMRVLAVDDNPTCLKLLETLLRKCQYHVTTTGHATTALQLLRENRNQFDLVISDVDMPDMDGFKLLELVGLEMNLPVIMLSAYGDTQLVKKGVTHGACDYLLKPVRIEELRIIWRHVFRRKILDSMEPKISDKVAGEQGDSDHHGKLNRKRKDQNDNDDEKQDSNGQNYEDPLSQKKPRLVWSKELHKKFVDAVHQLGMKEAVPKKILETMNVQKLTRGNVASHLQKYRKYLKKISRVEIQQANMTAIQILDSPFVHNGSLHGVANCQSMIARLNSPASFGMQSSSSSGMIQSGHACITNPTNGVPNAYSDILSGNQSINILHGMSKLLDIDQAKYRKDLSPRNGVISSTNLDSVLYYDSSGFIGTKVDADTRNSIFGSPNNSTMLVGHLQDVQMKEVVGIQSSIRSASINSNRPINITKSSDSPAKDVQTCLVQLESSSMVSSEQPTSNDLKDMSTLASSMPTNLQNIAAFASVLSGDLDSRIDFQCETPVIMNGSTENLNFIMRQDLDDLEQNAAFRSNILHHSISSSEPFDGALGLFNHESGTNFYVNSDEFSSVGQMDFLDPLPRQHARVGLAAEMVKQDYLEERMAAREYLDYNKIGSLEDLVTMMMKEENYSHLQRQ